MRDDGLSARAGVEGACSARTGADDALLEEVAEVFRVLDPVPWRVKGAARELLAWRSVDAGLAELLSRDASAARPAAR